jgi:hypothetical protein
MLNGKQISTNLYHNHESCFLLTWHFFFLAEGDGRKLTLFIVKTVVQSYNGQNGLTLSPVQAIDAFSVPFIEYDMIRKLFHSSALKRKVIADAKVKIYSIYYVFLVVLLCDFLNMNIVTCRVK